MSVKIVIVSMLMVAVAACASRVARKHEFLAAYHKHMDAVKDCQSLYLARLYVITKSRGICRGANDCESKVADTWASALDELKECRRHSIAASTELALTCNESNLSHVERMACGNILGGIAGSGGDADDEMSTIIEDHREAIDAMRDGDEQKDL